MKGHKIITRKQTFVINCTHNIFFLSFNDIYILFMQIITLSSSMQIRSKYSCVFRHEPIKSKITCPLPDAFRC